MPRRMSSQYVEAREFGAMSESAPVGCFAAEKIWQAANAEVRIIVRNKDRNFGGRRFNSWARSAALIPASLPPMMRRCTFSSFGWQATSLGEMARKRLRL